MVHPILRELGSSHIGLVISRRRRRRWVVGHLTAVQPFRRGEVWSHVISIHVKGWFEGSDTVWQGHRDIQKQSQHAAVL
jgi:hypothetical protein